MTTAVHQFVASLAPRDAVGGHTLAMRDLLRNLGFESEIFTGEAQVGMEGVAHPYRRFARMAGRRGNAWLLYQCSVGSPIADFIRDRPEPTILYFHGITPRRLLEGWEPDVLRAVSTGWIQLARLAPQLRVGWAASRSSEVELRRTGVDRTRVVPLLVDLAAIGREVDKDCYAELQAGKTGTDLLFVGRLSPHKAQHVLIQTLAAYRRAYDPGARLHLVGGTASGLYEQALIRYAADLGLAGAVHLAGSVTPAQLAAHYRSADVFVCASRHEGFCIPLVEAMHHSLPIVAYGAAAVAETVGGAGVVVPTQSPLHLAAGAHRVLGDPGLSQTLAAGARQRLEDLALPRARAAVAAAVEEVVGGG